MAPKSPAETIARWLVLLPAAFAGAALLQILIVAGNAISMGSRFGFETFLAQLFVRTLSNAALGASFVWIGVFIAPAHKRAVAVLMMCLLTALSVLIGLTGATIDSGWDYWALIVNVLAAVATSAYLFAMQPQVATVGEEEAVPLPAPSKLSPWLIGALVVAVLGSVVVPVGTWLVLSASPSPGPAVQEEPSTVVAPPAPAPSYITVPAVVGMKQQDAADLITSSGLKVIQGAGWYYDTVRSQSPVGGSSVERGSGVTLWAE